MTDIAINRCPKGIFLSYAGFEEYLARTGRTDVALEDVPRDDPVLVQMMRENPVEFSGRCSHISIITIPDGIPWQLNNRGNYEWVSA